MRRPTGRSSPPTVASTTTGAAIMSVLADTYGLFLAKPQATIPSVGISAAGSASWCARISLYSAISAASAATAASAIVGPSGFGVQRKSEPSHTLSASIGFSSWPRFPLPESW